VTSRGIGRDTHTESYSNDLGGSCSIIEDLRRLAWPLVHDGPDLGEEDGKLQQCPCSTLLSNDISTSYYSCLAVHMSLANERQIDGLTRSVCLRYASLNASYVPHCPPHLLRLIRTSYAEGH